MVIITIMTSIVTDATVIKLVSHSVMHTMVLSTLVVVIMML